MKNGIIQLFGHTEIWIHRRDGRKEKILDKRNAIQDGIIEEFVASFSNGAIDFAIDDLITDGGETFGGTMTGKDGIVCRHVDGVETRPFTCVTTVATPAQTYGKKWRGEVVFAADWIITGAALGKGFSGSSVTLDNYFSTMYALQTFSAVNVGNLDKLVFNWEVYV